MALTENATSSRAFYGKSEDQYMALVRRFPLRPLCNDADLDAAIAVIDSLIDQDIRSAPAQDYLDVLSDLVQAYETENVPIGPVADSDMLRFLIENRAVTQSEFAKKADIAESTISEVLAGKRKLNRSQIGKLARYFHVEPGAFAFGE